MYPSTISFIVGDPKSTLIQFSQIGSSSTCFVCHIRRMLLRMKGIGQKFYPFSSALKHCRGHFDVNSSGSTRLWAKIVLRCLSFIKNCT